MQLYASVEGSQALVDRADMSGPQMVRQEVIWAKHHESEGKNEYRVRG